MRKRPDVLEWIAKTEQDYQYPGETTTPEDARVALKAMRRARKFFIGRYSF